MIWGILKWRKYWLWTFSNKGVKENTNLPHGVMLKAALYSILSLIVPRLTGWCLESKIMVLKVWIHYWDEYDVDEYCVAYLGGEGPASRVCDANQIYLEQSQSTGTLLFSWWIQQVLFLMVYMSSALPMMHSCVHGLYSPSLQ